MRRKQMHKNAKTNSGSRTPGFHQHHPYKDTKSIKDNNSTIKKQREMKALHPPKSGEDREARKQSRKEFRPADRQEA